MEDQIRFQCRGPRQGETYTGLRHHATKVSIYLKMMPNTQQEQVLYEKRFIGWQWRERDRHGGRRGRPNRERGEKARERKSKRAREKGSG